MDWNPADEFIGPDPYECEVCSGTGGMFAFCHECKGTGRILEHQPVITKNNATQEIVPDDDLPF